ncbi:RNA polymerase sigma factor [Nocardia camponoti]|uniref:RNA polymerase subunit sigma-24 n=1 Tax=Nocardia camponoti TaxID=1616106 RepID=A0A917QAG4_9NOCA|nr:sigma-70 family RNA polymerase sigma factor [Nocardia camponoti]GGK39579.1 RNA polymerase subunit sigma-24 [Nocardia camponoti]
MTAETAVAAAVEQAHRREWAFVLAATVRLVRDIDLAEECVQEAYETALTAWVADGIPDSPGAWLTTVARRRALDKIRRESTLQRLLPRLVVDDDTVDDPADLALLALDKPIPDDRLRLISTCCHPALSESAQVALTLRLVCGMTTHEVARAFLVSESTMAARLTRAKRKIAVAGIPYRVPSMRELPARVDAVCRVVHLLFTTGHTAPTGTELVRADLVERAKQVARMMRALIPADPTVTGLLALILLTDARRDARVDADGTMRTLEFQDRAKWDRAAIAEGIALVKQALAKQSLAAPDPYTLAAAIAAVHDEAPTWADTDWREIIGLYQLLLRDNPTPVTRLNHAIAVGFSGNPARALTLLDALVTEPALRSYGYLQAARATFLAELGHRDAAVAAYDMALMQTTNAVEAAHLRTKLAALTG